MTVVEFAWGTTLVREDDRSSDLPIVRNGPPGTFVHLPQGIRVSLPTDQIVHADVGKGRARVEFGGMRFDGATDGQLVFSRVRELQPEEQLSPDRSVTMFLNPEWVSAVIVNGSRAWPGVVYKIVPAAVWHASAPSGAFPGSGVDERDGFIHFSTAAQVRATASKYFAGAGGLLLVAVSIDAIDLRWEPSRNGDLFPHLYRPLPLSAVSWIRELPLGSDGQHVFPALA